MKVQWEILLFLVILNLVVGVVIALNVPGSYYTSPMTESPSASDYEAHFNATQIATSWSATPFSGIPVIGDIFGGFNFLWQMFGYILDGFPTLLTWVSDSYITTADGQTAFWVLANVIRAIEAMLISAFLIEFISGRVFTD